MTDDNVSKGRSNELLERVAEYCAEAAGESPAPHTAVEYIQLLAPKFKATHGLDIKVLPDSELNGAEAIATCDPPLIRVRQTVYTAACRNEPRARMTMMHEFAHILLEHKIGQNPRMLEGNERLGFAKPFASAEHQAQYLGAALLMPRSMAKGLTAAELKLKFRVSQRAAEIRFEQLNSLPRVVPSFVSEFLSAKKRIEPSLAEARIADVNLRLDKIWARAPVVEGEDPAEYRLDLYGIPVRRSRFLKMQIGGWKLDRRDNIVSYEYEQTK